MPYLTVSLRFFVFAELSPDQHREELVGMKSLKCVSVLIFIKGNVYSIEAGCEDHVSSEISEGPARSGTDRLNYSSSQTS